MVLQSCLLIPEFCLFPILFHTNGFFVEPGKVILTVTVTVLRSPARPIDSFFQVFFYSQTLIVEISHLAFRKRIALSGKGQMSLETFFILLCVKIFLNQLITDCKLFTGFIVGI